MFFILSKVLWAVVAPSNFILLLLVLGLVALFMAWRGTATTLLTLSGLLYIAGGIGPLGNLLLRPLEDRFQRPAETMPAPTGIIVLGGSIDETMLRDRNVVMLGFYGSRMTEGVALSRRFPQARFVFTGGSASLLQDEGITESDAARRFFVELGVPEERMTFETRSRNTDENAVFTSELVRPQPGQTWVLVTSAFHMPRSVGLFRKAGFDVVPWPADYMTHGSREDYGPNRTATTGLDKLDIAVREWIGLVAYRISGRTQTLLPAP